VRTEFFNYCRDVMGFKLLAPQPHLEICDFIQEALDPFTKPPYRHPEQKFYQLMVPRGFYKTTIGAEGGPAYVIEPNPNIRILLDAHSDQHSQESLAGLKSIVESEEWIESRGQWARDDDTDEAAAAWRVDAITVAMRTQMGLREPTITCAGVNKSKVGGHYDIIIADDLADDKNTQSETLRAKTMRRIGGYVPMLNPGGVVLMLGTRWHLLDCYHTLQKQDDERAKRGIAPQWKRLVRRIFTPDGRPYFPSQYPIEAIAQLRETTTAEEFSKWYLNEAVDDKARVFPPNLFRFFDGSFALDENEQGIARVIPA
jgi:hypothetical protein